MPSILETNGLQAFYGGTQALFGVDVQVAEAGITALLGANGAGKTTTLRAVCQLVRTSGTVRFRDTELSGLKTEEIARLGLAHVPDGRGTFTDLTVEDNLRLGAYLRNDKAAVAADIDKVLSYFPILGKRFRQQAGTLSGGEQQMLAISRALMQRPKLILLDEPSFGLAPLIVREIFGIMRTINQKESVSMLLVEQNARLALELADTAYLIETGRIVFSGSAVEMQGNDGVRRAYLGY